MSNLTELKAVFRDEAGQYKMTFTYNPELYSIRDIILNECERSKSVLVKILV
jgi:hypothetical protein